MTANEGIDRDAHFLARINTRESSTLTLATVGASSSLVVLALVIDRNAQVSYPWLTWIGILFSLLGVLYREATNLSIDTSEYGLLSDELWNLIEKQREGRKNQAYALTRRVAVRFFLWIPFVAWLGLFWKLEPSIVAIFLIALLIVSVVLSSRHLAPRPRLEKNSREQDGKVCND